MIRGVVDHRAGRMSALRAHVELQSLAAGF
jgi:hypothetical protein